MQETTEEQAVTGSVDGENIKFVDLDFSGLAYRTRSTAIAYFFLLSCHYK